MRTMANQKEKFKEFSARVKYMRTLEKDILIGFILGMNKGSDKDFRTAMRYMKRELRQTKKKK